jgi:hypothetical protein
MKFFILFLIFSPKVYAEAYYSVLLTGMGSSHTSCKEISGDVLVPLKEIQSQSKDFGYTCQVQEDKVVCKDSKDNLLYGYWFKDLNKCKSSLRQKLTKLANQK